MILKGVEFDPLLGQAGSNSIAILTNNGDARSEPVLMFAKHLRSSSLERGLSPIRSLTYCIEKSYSILVIFECEKK